MEKDQADERKKLPRKIEKSKSDPHGSHYNADRKLSAEEIKTFGTLPQQRLQQQQRREAYNNKLSEILNRIHKSTPCSTFTLDSNDKEEKGQTKLDISGPQYTFDNYDDDTVVAEDLESVNVSDQIQPLKVSVESGPEYILNSSDFYSDEEETSIDKNAVSAFGKVLTVESRPIIMPEYALANEEDSTCQRKLTSKDNEKMSNHLSTSQQHNEESELHDRPGAVAVGLDNHESFRSIAGTRFRTGNILQQLQSWDTSSFGTSDLRYSIYPRYLSDSKKTSSSISFSIEQNENQLPEVVQPYVVEESDVEIPRGTSNEVNLDSSPVIAEAVDTKAHRNTFLKILSIGLVLIACIVVLIVLFARKQHGNVGPTPLTTLGPTKTENATLEAIKERGILRCGVPPLWPGFIEINETTGEKEGFKIDSCRAIAAAVIGANYSIDAIELPWAERFLALANKSVDLLVQGTTHTMERDTYQSDAETGFSFSIPYLYGGLGFGGEPSFVECADNIQAYGNCSELKICVLERSTHYKILEDLFPDRILVASSSGTQSREKIINGDCNVMSDEKNSLSKQLIQEQGYTGRYIIGKAFLSKEPLAIVTRDHDHKWSQVVNWVLQSLFLAEAMEITQETAAVFSNVSPFGDKYNEMFINAISAVGNYGERYKRHLEKIFPREGLNMLYLGKETSGEEHRTNGLIYSHPFGPIDADGPQPTGGSRLSAIAEHGMLRCGITEIKDGFATLDAKSQEWEGLDVDYCKAIASAIFGSVVDTIQYIDLTNKAAFDALIDRDDIDLLCGVAIDIEASIGLGISFSQPYFYEGQLSSRSLATYGKDDPQFADFVWWIVTATFYAEEQNITSSNFFDAMPEVRIFGPNYYEMFRNVIIATGNYGDMYERNVQPIIPRSGRNNLNRPMVGPQINPYVGWKM